jgi:hypothetical protein
MPESENLCDLLALVTEEWREKLGGRKCDWHYTSPWHDFSALLADFDDMERLGESSRGASGHSAGAGPQTAADVKNLVGHEVWRLRKTALSCG